MRWLNLCGFCCGLASDFPATIFASSRRAASMPAGLNSPIKCRTRSIGGSSGAASRAGSTRTSRWTSSSGFRRCCCRAGPNGRASTTVCCAKCGAPAQAWSCLPLQTKTQLGDALLALVKKGEMVETGLWCLSRLGARKLFYGPINQVLPVRPPRAGWRRC